MKKRKGELSGFLDHETELKGDISFADMLRINGKFEGSIRSGRTLIVGEGADVHADIEVETIFVSGRLRGSIRGAERVELLSTARVQSQLDTAVLVVEEGAIFEGECSMKGASGPREVASDKLTKFASSE